MNNLQITTEQMGQLANNLYDTFENHSYDATKMQEDIVCFFGRPTLFYVLAMVEEKANENGKHLNFKAIDFLFD